jgi:hypothetical protein
MSIKTIDREEYGTDSLRNNCNIRSQGVEIELTCGDTIVINCALSRNATQQGQG